MKDLTVFEFDTITQKSFDKDIAEVAFSQLKEFILPHKNDDDDDAIGEFDEQGNASACMRYGSKGGQETIFVRNYVGTIALPCGVVIEVLPKISLHGDKALSRKLVVEMLRVCGVISYKSFQNTNLHEDRLNLFEIYIELFLNEVTALYKRGLRSGYVAIEQNEKFLKGKLIFNEHIKYNSTHKERFFVEYELFDLNRAENRLIKSTLIYLKNKCKSEENIRTLRRLLLMFDEINQSENIESDFAKCANDRSTKDYECVMKLCRVFLRRKSFSMYSGDNNVVALLFPMEKLYEKYIAYEMQKAIASGWYLQTQSKERYLFDKKQFLLQPDIVLKQGKEVFVIVDTKWKKLDKKKLNLGISQADMYQMYAYHTRFNSCKNVVLLYPYDENIDGVDPNKLIYNTKVDSIDVSIYVSFFKLKDYLQGKAFKSCLFPDSSSWNADWTTHINAKK